MAGKQVLLDLACGRKKHAGHVGIDRVKGPGVDVVADLNEGIPLGTGSVDEIKCYWFLEHCGNVVALMEEIHRVLRPRGTVTIKVPYYVHFHAFNDPTNTAFFAFGSFDYFTAAHDYNFYTKARFKIKLKKFACSEGNKLLGRFIMALANRWPHFYERYLNKFLRAEYLDVILEKA